MGSPGDSKALAELGLVASKQSKFHCVPGCGGSQGPGSLCHFVSGHHRGSSLQVLFPPGCSCTEANLLTLAIT